MEPVISRRDQISIVIPGLRKAQNPESSVFVCGHVKGAGFRITASPRPE
jgi:hypothetical protein